MKSSRIFAPASIIALIVSGGGIATAAEGTGQQQQPSAENSAKIAAPTILFLGDSITAGGGYVRAIGAELAKKHPDNPPRVINRGRSSETVSNLSEAYHPGRRPWLHKRLDKEFETAKPDWVVACYGINCGIYHPFSEERFAAYKEGIEKLIEKVHATGGRVVLLTPPPYAKAGPPFPEGSDAKAQAKIVALANAAADAEAKKNPRKFGYRSPYVYYDRVIARYAEWLLTLEKRDNVWVVDLRTPMLPKLKDAYGRDPIHPNKTGHQIMAKSFLKRWPKIAADAGKQ